MDKIGEFQPSVEDWTQYGKCLEFFFAANDITTAKKKCATFLAVVGPTTYKLLRSMLAPNKPVEVAFNEMVKVLSDHYVTVQSRRRLYLVSNSTTEVENLVNRSARLSQKLEIWHDFVTSVIHWMP